MGFESESDTWHDGDGSFFEEVRGDIAVVCEDFSVGRGVSDESGTRGIDVESTLGCGAADSWYTVEGIDDFVASCFEGSVSVVNELLFAVKSGDSGPLADGGSGSGGL